MKNENKNECRGCEEEGSEESHKCPYQETINGSDDEHYCTCCSDCEQECRRAV